MQENPSFENHFIKLPKAVKIFMADELPNIFVALEQKYHLHVDVSGKVANMVGDTIVGILSPSDFVKGIKNLSEIQNEDKENLLRDFEELVFKKVRDIATKPYVASEDEEDLDELPPAVSAEFVQKVEPQDVRIAPPAPKSEIKSADAPIQHMETVKSPVIPVQNVTPSVISSDAQVTQTTSPVQNNESQASTKTIEEKVAPTPTLEPKKSPDPYREPIDF